MERHQQPSGSRLRTSGLSRDAQSGLESEARRLKPEA